MSTLSERILGGTAGEFVDREVDRAYAHDGTGVLTLEAWHEMGTDTVAHPERVYCSLTTWLPPTIPRPQGCSQKLAHSPDPWGSISVMWAAGSVTR